MQVAMPTAALSAAMQTMSTVQHQVATRDLRTQPVVNCSIASIIHKCLLDSSHTVDLAGSSTKVPVIAGAYQPYSFFSTASRKNLQMMSVLLGPFSAACFSATAFSSSSWSQSSIPSSCSRLHHVPGQAPPNVEVLPKNFSQSWPNKGITRTGVYEEPVWRSGSPETCF